MKAHFIGPALFVKDITISKQFYLLIFQLNIKHDFGTNLLFEEGLALWQPNPQHEIAQKHPYNPNDNSRFELYFECNDLEEIQSKLNEYGVSYLHKIKEESWGQRTLRFYDPDNHLVEVGETLNTFVQRLVDNGMTKEQIADKTGIPLQDLDKILD